MSTDLPFEIKARHTGRDVVMFIVSVDGKELASERYTIGNGDRRRKVAERWSNDDRLRGNMPVKASDVAKELEALELRIKDNLDEVREADSQEKTAVERAGHVDESIIVELAWNWQLGAVDFIIFDRVTKGLRRSEQVDTTVGTISPPSIRQGVVTPGSTVPGMVFIPTECDEGGSDENSLRADVTEFIERYVEFPVRASVIATDYVFLSWIHDAFDELPYLSFRTSDAGRGKSRALETVGALCYRPIFCGGGSTAAATLRLLDVFGGTLVADEFDQKHTELAAELTRILNQGFQRNRPLIRCDGEANAPRAFYCFGPKLFALRRGLGDDATETRTLSIRMTQRTREDIPINLPRRQFDTEALALRNRLLGWRFANLGRIAIDPAMVDPRLEDRYNQIGLPLLAVSRTDEARERTIEALIAQQGSVAADRADSLAGEVFEAALATAQPGELVRPGDVAKEVNRRRAATEAVEVDKLRKPINAWKVGRLLASELELPREPRDEGGARYRLDRSRLEQLARRFAVDLPGTSQTSERQSTAEASPENPLLEGVSGDSDVPDVPDVSPVRDDVPDVEPGVGSDTDVSVTVPDGWTAEGYAIALANRATRTDDPEMVRALREQAAAIRQALGRA